MQCISSTSFLGVCAILQKATFSFMSVHPFFLPSTSNISAQTGQIFMKFDI